MRWRYIPGHEGRYEVSETGCVRNSRTGRLLKPILMKTGYTEVKLQSDHGECRYYVHRLVAAAFVPGDTALHVNHKDGAKANNVATNLEWVTHAQNVKHGFDTGLRGAPCNQYAVKVGDEVFPSLNAASRAFGKSVGAIHSALTNGRLFQGKEICRV